LVSNLFATHFTAVHPLVWILVQDVQMPSGTVAHSVVQQSEAVHVPVVHVTLVGLAIKWFVPPTQDAKSVPLPSMLSHVGLASQHSDTVHVPVAQVFVSTSFKCFVPPTHDAKSAPPPSMSSHVGLASQQSEAVHVSVAQVFVSTSFK
jgi:hypothetical protein